MLLRKELFDVRFGKPQHRLAHAHCRAGCGIASLRIFFFNFSKNISGKTFLEKHFYFFFQKCFLKNWIIFFQKYESAQNVQVGAAPVNRILKSELNKSLQGRHRNSARNSSFSSNLWNWSFKMAARSPVCLAGVWKSLPIIWAADYPSGPQSDILCDLLTLLPQGMSSTTSTVVV